MKTNLTEKQVLEKYKKSSSTEKKLLEEIYGSDTFKPKVNPKDITTVIKTVADAYMYLKMKRVIFKLDIPKKELEFLQATYDATVVCKALNECWAPNWDNNNEYKYYPWFYMDSGSGFACDIYDLWCSNTDTPARLCFRDERRAKYAATQFVDLYKKVMTM